MKILINGDSNMSGEELDDVSLSVGHQFCHMLGGDVINLAIAGASNDRIYESTMRIIDNEPIDFVLIGWTEMSRLQWFATIEGYERFYEINNLCVGDQPDVLLDKSPQPVPSNYRARYHHWKKFMADSHEFRKVMSLYWHERIYNVHALLTYRRIPHLFFHAFDRFHIYDQEYQLDWQYRYIDPYESQSPSNSYMRWCLRQNYQQITPGLYHFEPAAQRRWAELLVDHVRDHHLLEI